MKTHSAYFTEKNAFENSVVEVATAVPAFIGYTEKANNGRKTLLNKPTRITCIAEYMQFFGGSPVYKYLLNEFARGVTEISENNEATPEAGFSVKGTSYTLSQTGEKYILFNALRLFFQNGGESCYIVSVGNYSDNIDGAILIDNGITPLLKEVEPTIVVIPEAIYLKYEDCVSVQQAVLKHCGKMQSRIGILDVYDGYKERNDPDGDVIDNFRNSLGVNSLNYGAAYYPWLHTTIVDVSELGIFNLTDESLAVLKDLVMMELNVPDTAEDDEPTNVSDLRALLAHIPNIHKEAYEGPSIEKLNEKLTVISPAYISILLEIKKQQNLLPPSSAMAGVYTLVDNSIGVWKAPANVSLNSVSSPAVNISHDGQKGLNAALHGKSINAIRSFMGEGVLVWGARTLDGNSKDWRYINVRRTMIMLEQSIKAAARAYIFEPNDANTWTVIKSVIDKFLYNQWKAGALLGASPDDSYSVTVGLGSTMTGDDILEGILRITVLVAISRPAEFIEITFQQQMQKS